NSQTTTYNYEGANPDAVTQTTTTGLKPAPIISYFIASPSEIESGKPAVLSWAVLGGTPASLEIDNEVGPVLGSNFKLINPAETTTYTLTAENAGGAVTKSVTITVNQPAPPSGPGAAGLALTAKAAPVIDSFDASPSTIIKGQSTTFSWSLSGGAPTSLSLRRGNSVVSVLHRTSRESSPSADAVYTLTAKNKYGSAVKSIAITVNPQPPVIKSFASSPSKIIKGKFATLYWSLSGGKPESLTIDNGVGVVLGKTKIAVRPAVTTTYTVTAQNISGVVTKSFTVTVNPPSPIITSFTADSKIIARGQSATLFWSLSGGAPTTLSINKEVGSVLGLTSKTVTPTVTTTYTLTAENISGKSTKSIKITAYESAPVISSFTAEPTNITKGKSATLLWIISGTPATSLSIDNGIGSVFKTASKKVSPSTTTDYTITAKNKYGSAEKSVTVTVNPPSPIIISFTANPSTIIKGQSAALSWSLSGGEPASLSIDKGVGSVIDSFSADVAPIETTTYTLTATNISGTATKSVTVTVNPPVPVISNFSASPNTIIKGESATLFWSLSGGAPSSLEIDHGVGNVLGKSGIIVKPAETTTYTLTAKNISGTAAWSITIAVNTPLPIIDSFSAEPATITKGEFATLSWTLSGGAPTALSIDKGVGSVLGASSKNVSPLATTTYTLTAENDGGSVAKSVTITVNKIPAPAILSFTASPANIEKGQSATLSWSLSGGKPTTLIIDNSISSVLNKTSIAVKPEITTTYVLTAKNESGTVIQPVALEVAADPAPTTSTTDYIYDANGNLLSDSANSYEYDYNNRLISAENTAAGTTTAFAYDPSGQRIKLATAAATTIYPSQFYNSTNYSLQTTNSIVKHIFA
ncbi:MAG: hypothetical protein AAB925_02535, partial [Patescibacteria group bacterium]